MDCAGGSWMVYAIVRLLKFTAWRGMCACRTATDFRAQPSMQPAPSVTTTRKKRLPNRHLTPHNCSDGTLFWSYSVAVIESTTLKANFVQPRKPGPRAEYAAAGKERTLTSISLAENFKILNPSGGTHLWSPTGTDWNNEITYEVNLAHAKSVFRFDCVNSECVGGDFDLSELLAKAVQARRATVSGEMCCQGWSSRETINLVRCHNILRYKLSLKY